MRVSPKLGYGFCEILTEFPLHFCPVLLGFNEFLRRKRLSPGTQDPVQVERGTDQRQVRKRLWKVPEAFAVMAGLFGVESEVIGIAQHLLERQSCLIDPARAGKRFD